MKKNVDTAKLSLYILGTLTVLLIPFGGQFFSYRFDHPFPYTYQSLLILKRYLETISQCNIKLSDAEIVTYFNSFLFLLIAIQLVISLKYKLAIRYIYFLILPMFAIYSALTMYMIALARSFAH